MDTLYSTVDSCSPSTTQTREAQIPDTARRTAESAGLALMPRGTLSSLNTKH